MFEYTIGKALPNGAILQAIRMHKYGDYVVLAIWEEHTAPYVCWRADRYGNTYWGKYHTSKEAAQVSFNER